MKKVAFLISTIYGAGGVQRVLNEIANELVNYYEITIIHTSIDPAYGQNLFYEYDSRINIIYNEEIGFRFSNFQRIIKKIHSKIGCGECSKWFEFAYYPKITKEKMSEFLNEGKYDCVIGVTGTMSMLLAQIRKRLNCACIGWHHNSYEAYFRTKGKYCWGQESIAKKHLISLDACVLLTDADVKQYKNKFLCDARRIYNPLTIECSRKSTNSNRLIFCGRLVKQQKGLDYLAQILSDVLKTHNDWSAIVVGDGEDKDWLVQEMEKYGVAKNVEFVGNQSNVVQYYLNSAILVLPSRWEGFGLVVTEAFESGIPVVSFETEGPSEIIQNGVNGILIPKYNIELFCEKLNILMEDDNLRVQMGREAMMRAQDFSRSKIVGEWCTLISEVTK